MPDNLQNSRDPRDVGVKYKSLRQSALSANQTNQSQKAAGLAAIAGIAALPGATTITALLANDTLWTDGVVAAVNGFVDNVQPTN